jgi:serine/threonine protein kinase
VLPFIAIQVLEYMGGGDLLNLLIKLDVFEENFARFYAAEVCSIKPVAVNVASYIKCEDDSCCGTMPQAGFHSPGY